MPRELTPWIFPDTLPAFDDFESMTALEGIHVLYGKINELIEAFNTLENNVNEVIETFKTSTTEDIEEFKVAIRQEFQDFIDVVDLKVMDKGGASNG